MREFRIIEKSREKTGRIWLNLGEIKRIRDSETILENPKKNLGKSGRIKRSERIWGKLKESKERIRKNPKKSEGKFRSILKSLEKTEWIWEIMWEFRRI